MSDQFYADLPIMERFVEVADLERYVQLPEGWHVVVTDVQGSTEAIQSGLYKEVNTLGVAVITAVLSLARPLSIPFVFGGDGATICVPNSMVEKVPQALVAAKLLAKEAYGLEFRVGIVPVEVLHQGEERVLVARYRVSEHYVQAVFSGGGLQQAETLVKDPIAGKAYRLDLEDAEPYADFSHLECRWQNIPSLHGETIALLVSAITPSEAENAALYREIIDKIDEIYGEDKTAHPITMETLHPELEPTAIMPERIIRTFRQSGIGRFLYELNVWLRLKLGGFFLKRNVQSFVAPFNNYKSQLIENTDFKKFDDMVREVLSGTPDQRQRLTDYLENLHQLKKIVYGIHPSSAAVMTCLVVDIQGEHYHFVDGADGGYAIAAKSMKAQLKMLNAL